MEKDTIHQTFTKNPLKSFSPQPLFTYFETQEKGEKIILLLRAHLITLVPFYTLIFILFLTSIIVFQLAAQFRFNLTTILPFRSLAMVTFIWYFFLFSLSFYRFLHWYFNVHILTNERIVDIDFLGLVQKAISFCKLNQVQDVTPRVIGAGRTFFNFGDVFIQTAGTVPEFDFHAVPKPDIVAREILEQVRLEEAEAPGEIS